VDDNRLALGKGLFLGELDAGRRVDLLEHFVEFHIGLSNDVNLMGNGGSSWGLITSDHNDFNSSELAGSDGDVDLGAGRIVEGNETDEGQAPHGEPAGTLLGVGGSLVTLVNGIGLLVTEANPALGGEGVLSLGEVLRVEVGLGESENTLSHETEAIVSSVDVEVVGLVKFLNSNRVVIALDEDVVATLDDLLGGTLKVDGHVIRSLLRVSVCFVGITDHKVELDARVEGDGIFVLFFIAHGRVVLTEALESVFAALVSCPETLVLLHEERSEETDDTSLGSVTLGVTLHETAPFLFDNEFFLCLVVLYFFFGGEIIKALGEGDRAATVKLFVLSVPVLDLINCGVEVEDSGGGESKGLDKLLENGALNIVIGHLNLIRLSILSISNFFMFLLDFFLVRLPVNFGIDNFLADPKVGHSHSVLSEGAGLIGADARGGSESLDRLKVLNEDLLLMHALGSQSKGHSHGGEETLGHVSDNDTNGEDNHIDDGVLNNKETVKEEGDTEDDSDD